MAIQVTVITPVAGYHTSLVDRAAASVQAQTVACHHIVRHDEGGIGAGAMRNRMVAEVKTPFVVFLDADDWLHPRFVENTLNAWRPRHYVYTDWWKDDEYQDAPDAAWCGDGGWHVITTLLPTEAVRQVRGFDESLPGAEDTDFYWKLTRSGWTGKRVSDALFHYGKEGRRSKELLARADHRAIMNQITSRYRGKMGCGCQGKVDMTHIYGNRMHGDVVAIANWAGNRKFVGKATGRNYLRIGNQKPFWCDPKDLAAMPGTLLPEPKTMPVVANGMVEIGQRMVGGMTQKQTSYNPIAPAAASVPNFVRVVELYQGAKRG